MIEKRYTSGQSIIVAVVGLLALVAFVALAVDGARLYGERAQMQTAADAGALAGAAETCRRTTTRLVIREATKFAQMNGAQAVSVEVDIRKHTVGVVASTTAGTFFAGMIGFPEATVSASAAALAECGSGMRLVK